MSGIMDYSAVLLFYWRSHNCYLTSPWGAVVGGRIIFIKVFKIKPLQKRRT